MSSWSVVVPFKGAADAKSRLSDALSDDERAAIALAFLVDTLSAVRRVATVSSVIVVSNQAGLAGDLATVGAQVVADPGGGINAAVAAGLALARASAPEGFAAALTGDLAALRSADLAHAFELAEAEAAAGAGLRFVPDREGSGTTMVAFAPGADSPTHYGVGSSAAHVAAGYRALAVPAESSLRLDIDDTDDLERARMLGLGDATRAVLERVTPRSSDPSTRPAHAPGQGPGRAS